MNTNTPREGVTDPAAQNPLPAQNSTPAKPKELPLSRLVVVPITALLITGLIASGAIFTRYPGLIELLCNADSCRVVINGRTE